MKLKEIEGSGETRSPCLLRKVLIGGAISSEPDFRLGGSLGGLGRPPIGGGYLKGSVVCPRREFFLPKSSALPASALLKNHLCSQEPAGGGSLGTSVRLIRSTYAAPTRGRDSGVGQAREDIPGPSPVSRPTVIVCDNLSELQPLPSTNKRLNGQPPMIQAGSLPALIGPER